jgi:hypothetical protein
MKLTLSLLAIFAFFKTNASPLLKSEPETSLSSPIVVPPGCLKHDALYSDAHLTAQKNVNGMGSCITWCLESEVCVIWSFNKNTNTCHIMGNASTFDGHNVHVYRKGIVSGKKSCILAGGPVTTTKATPTDTARSPIVVPPGCLKHDAIYFASTITQTSTITQKHVNDMDSCITWCLKLKFCETWAFHENIKMCSASDKALAFDDNRHFYAKGIVSGKKSCILAGGPVTTTTATRTDTAHSDFADKFLSKLRAKIQKSLDDL